MAHENVMFVVDGTWEAMELIDVGSNAKVYTVRNAQNHSMGALKMEQQQNGSLDNEINVFKAIDQARNPEGLPEMLYHGHTDKRVPNKVLVMTLLGKSFAIPPYAHGPEANGPNHFTLPTVFRFTRQALARLPTFHGMAYIHNDLNSDKMFGRRTGVRRRDQSAFD